MVDFKFPDVGEGLTEARLVEWTVKEGDEIEEDDTVAHVETDKAVVDIPSPDSGTVTSLKADEDEMIKVGAVIMTIQTDSETEQTHSEKTQSQQPEEPKQKTTETYTTSSDDVLAMPRVRKEAQRRGIDLSTVTPTGNHGQVLLKDLETGSKQQRPKTGQHTTEETKELSEQELPEKEEPARDVGEYTPRNITFDGRPAQRGKAQESTQSTITQDEAKKIPRKISSLRKNIASNMKKSLEESAQFTVTEQADVTHIVEQRQRIKETKGNAPTLLAYFAKAALLALENHKKLNTTYSDGTQTYHKGIDLDVAVNTEDALYTPTIRRADTLDIVSLAEQIQDVANSVRKKDLSSVELGKGTFTITSLGILGGEYFTPILDTPRVAILGLGMLRQKPWIHDERIQKRHMLPLSLTVDHQVVDGADAAKYIKEVKHLLEHPEEILIQ